MRLEARIFRTVCAKNYGHQFKLLSVIEENLNDIFETYGRTV